MTYEPTVYAATCRADHLTGVEGRKALEAEVKAGLDRMAAKVRTLKLDEQAQSHTGSQGARLADAAKWNEHTTIEEHKDAYLIPRQALTVKLFLRLFKPAMEFRDERFKALDAASKARLDAINAEIDKRTAIYRRVHPANKAIYAASLRAYASQAMADFEATCTYVEGSNPVLAWKSDETLLNRRKGFDTLEHVAFKRTPNGRKEQTIEKESVDLPTWDASDYAPYERPESATDKRG